MTAVGEESELGDAAAVVGRCHVARLKIKRPNRCWQCYRIRLDCVRGYLRQPGVMFLIPDQSVGRLFDIPDFPHNPSQCLDTRLHVGIVIIFYMYLIRAFILSSGYY